MPKSSNTQGPPKTSSASSKKAPPAEPTTSHSRATKRNVPNQPDNEPELAARVKKKARRSAPVTVSDDDTPRPAQKAKSKRPSKRVRESEDEDEDEEASDDADKPRRKSKKKSKVADNADSAGEDLEWVEQQDLLPDQVDTADAPRKDTLEWHEWKLRELFNSL
jgi:hypothetical protein